MKLVHKRDVPLLTAGTSQMKQHQATRPSTLRRWGSKMLIYVRRPTPR